MLSEGVLAGGAPHAPIKEAAPTALSVLGFTDYTALPCLAAKSLQTPDKITKLFTRTHEVVHPGKTEFF